MRWYLLFCSLGLAPLCEAHSTYGYAEFIGDKFKLYVEENFGENEGGTGSYEASLYSLHGTVALQVLGRRLRSAVDTVFSRRGHALPTYSPDTETSQLLIFDVPTLGLERVRFLYTSGTLSDSEARTLGKALTRMCTDLRLHYSLSQYLIRLGPVAFSAGEYRRVDLRASAEPQGYVFQFFEDLTFLLTDYTPPLSTEKGTHYRSYSGVWVMQDEKILKLSWPEGTLPEAGLCPCRAIPLQGQGRWYYIKNRLADGFALETVRN